MRNKSTRIVLLLAAGLGALISQPAHAQKTTPDVFTNEIQRLQETWNVLDQLAERVWPGWSNYSTVPFYFEFPDGREMLIGHPNPPEGFRVIDTTSLPGKKICRNDRNAIALNMIPPLFGGGGAIPFGVLEGRPVTTVGIRLGATPKDTVQPGDSARARPDNRPPQKRYQRESEGQILLYIHELFHCYQETVYKWRYGNLRYNPDENYAACAELEGLALEKAYKEPDSNLAREFLKDFIVAREQKRRSMDTTEQMQESEQEIMEGGATYAELKMLELIKAGYRPRLTSADDPFFHAFADADSFLQEKLERLHTSRENTLESASKSYSFGAFQALLLGRFLPGWQTNFYQSGKMFDRVIAEFLSLSPEEKTTVWERVKSTYPYDTILAKHSVLIRERNSALEMIRDRKGTAYIVNFKKTQEYPGSRTGNKMFAMGLMHIYPDGIDRIVIEDVEFIGQKSPTILDQLYYVKWVDTEGEPGKTDYDLSYGRKDGQGIFYDAVFTTRGFTLKAPKIQVSQHPNRVKVTILSKVKE